MCLEDDPQIRRNPDAARDLTNCAAGIIWQLTLVLIPVYAVFRNFRGLLAAVLVLIITSAFLKKFWYDNLVEEEAMMREFETVRND
jgi:hypothetical protein